MWLYFDKNGALLEILEHGSPARSGTTNFEIFVYFDGIVNLEEGKYPEASIKLYKPDLNGTSYPLLLMEKKIKNRFVLDRENNEHSEYFENGKEYNGYVLDFRNFIMPETGEATVVLDTPGVWKTVITLISTENHNVLGEVLFTVQPGIEYEDGLEGGLDAVLRQMYAILSGKLDSYTKSVRVTREQLLDPEIGYKMNTLYFVIGENSDQPYTVEFWNGVQYEVLGTVNLNAFASKEEMLAFEERLIEQQNLFKYEINQEINQIRDNLANPFVVIASISELPSVDTNKIYVVSADNHYYYWNGTEYVDGGLFLNSGIGIYDITEQNYHVLNTEFYSYISNQTQTEGKNLFFASINSVSNWDGKIGIEPIGKVVCWLDSESSSVVGISINGTFKLDSNGKTEPVGVGVNQAKDVEYDNETSGLNADNVQSALDEIESKKADTNGFYPGMHVGLANDLLNTDGVEVEGTFAFRPTAGDLSVVDNDISEQYAEIKSLKGKTLVVNQLVDLDSTGTSKGLTFTNNGDGTITISGTTTETGIVGFIKSIQIYAGNKYVCQGFPARTTDFSFYNGSYFTIPADGYGILESTQTEKWAIFMSIKTVGVAINLTFKPRITNLTKAFGAGNEPTTIAEFNNLTRNIDIDTYNEGTLVDMTANMVQSVGFNAFDEEWEIGGISDQGNLNSNVYNARSKNYISVVAGQNYAFSNRNYVASGTSAIYVAEYDKNLHIIKRTALDNFRQPNTVRTIQLGNSTMYIKFFIFISDYDFTNNLPPKGNWSFHLTHSGYRNGQYEPYWTETRQLPSVNTFFPNGMKGAGNVYDELTTTMVSKRIASVDLGTLTWTYDGTNFKAVLPSESVYAGLDIKPNILCSKYTASTVRDLAYDHTNDKVCSIYPATTILIRDSAYTDANALKQSLQGIYLYYQLVTPTTLTKDYTAKVDLGSLSCTISSAGGDNERITLYDSSIGNMKIVANNQIANLLCADYTTASADDVYLHRNDKTISGGRVVGNNGFFEIYDSALIGKTPEEVKTLLTGKIVYYQTTEKVTDDSIFGDNWIYRVSDYGTESTNGFMASNTLYMASIRDFVRNIGRREDIQYNPDNLVSQEQIKDLDKSYTFDGALTLNSTIPGNLGFTSLDEVKQINKIIWNNPSDIVYNNIIRPFTIYRGTYIFEKQHSNDGGATFTCDLTGYYINSPASGDTRILSLRFSQSFSSLSSRFDINDQSASNVFFQKEFTNLNANNVQNAIVELDNNQEKVRNDLTEQIIDLKNALYGSILSVEPQTYENVGVAVMDRANGYPIVDNQKSKLESIKGKSLVVNQLAEITVRSQSTNGVDKLYNESTDTFHINGTATANAWLLLCRSKLIANNKYLIKCKEIDKSVGFYYSSEYSIQGSSIITSASNINAADIHLVIKEGQTVDFDAYIKVINLTQCFGAGNEPTTIEEFNRLTMGFDFDTYNTGTIESTEISKIATRGQYVSVDLGTLTFHQSASMSGRWSSINSVYAKPTPVTELANIKCSELTPTIFNNVYGGKLENSITITDNGKGVYIYGSLYAGKTSQEMRELLSGIILYYEPANPTDAEILTEVEIEPVELNGIGTVQDEITETELKKVIGSVDLGTLTYPANQVSYGAISNSLKEIIKKPSAYNVEANILCSKYQKVREEIIASSPNSICITTGGNLIINDTALVGKSNAEVQEMLGGTYFYYELATPVITNEGFGEVLFKVQRGGTIATDSNGDLTLNQVVYKPIQ